MKNRLLSISTILIFTSLIFINLGICEKTNDKLIINLNEENSSNYYQVMSDPIDANVFDKLNNNTPVSIIETPDEHNWRNHYGKDWTTPAKNQGNCGSCWDFAAIGTFESIIKIRENRSEINLDLSEQYVGLFR